jgi:DNA-binding response OmpR family regulator
MEQPRHILVIDDDDAVRDTLGMMLRRQGYAVTLANDGPAALAQLHRQEFDLVVIDLLLPRMDGLNLAQHVRTRQPSAAVLILTGYTAPVQISGLADDYIVKTVGPREVLARIAALIVRERTLVALA